MPRGYFSPAFPASQQALILLDNCRYAGRLRVLFLACEEILRSAWSYCDEDWPILLFEQPQSSFWRQRSSYAFLLSKKGAAFHSGLIMREPREIYGKFFTLSPRAKRAG
jgi:hypothetical protein